MARGVPVKQASGRPLKVLVPIRNWAIDVAQFIVDYMETNNRIASGDSINSVAVEVVKPKRVFITANESVKFALAGRKAGKGPPMRAIVDWILEKNGKFGFRWNPREISLNSLAFLIGRKIKEKGTNSPKLRAQNIALVIESKGKKHLADAGLAFAKEASAQWIAAITKAGNKNVTVR